jgi:micrococcal nuclease
LLQPARAAADDPAPRPCSLLFLSQGRGILPPARSYGEGVAMTASWGGGPRPRSVRGPAAAVLLVLAVAAVVAVMRAGGGAATSPSSAPPPGVPADAIGPFRVLRVVDGDTVHVSLHGDTTIRLIGMDTPETVDPRKPVQCFGRQASTRAHQLLDGKKVYLGYDASQGRRDVYGRTLAYLWVGGRDYDEQMIAMGYAHEYTYDTPYRYRPQFRAAQRRARKASRGLWSPATCGGDTARAADG